MKQRPGVPGHFRYPFLEPLSGPEACSEKWGGLGEGQKIDIGRFGTGTVAHEGSRGSPRTRERNE